MHRLIAVLAVLALSLAPAGVAQAQLGGPDVPTPLTEPPPPPPVVDNDVGDEGLSTLQQVLIFGAAALVLAVIAFVIVRDARRSAPVDERPRKGGGAATGGKGATGSRAAGAAADTSAGALRARERQRAKRAKAKAKAARDQRKRNRPR